jgi:hypothetical protein
MSRLRPPRPLSNLPYVVYKPWAKRARTTPFSQQEILDQQEVAEWDALVAAAKEDAWHRDDIAIEEGTHD